MSAMLMKKILLSIGLLLFMVSIGYCQKDRQSFQSMMDAYTQQKEEAYYQQLYEANDMRDFYSSDKENNTRSARDYQCSLENQDAFAPRVAMTVWFWSGILIMVFICIGLLIFIVHVVPMSKRVQTCPAADLVHAQKIIIPLREKDIIITSDMLEFNDIINNFLDENIPSDDSMYPTRLDIKIGHRRYPIEISILGWNFLGEERNSRRLRNGMELMAKLQRIKEKSQST